MSGKTLKEKSLASVKSLALPLGLTYLTKFIQVPILALFLSPTDFGIWGLATVLIKAMESLTEVGLKKLLVQRDTVDDDYLRSIWGVMIIRGLFITLVALLIVPFYTSFVESPEGQFIFTLAIIVPAIQAFTTPALYLAEREIEFKNIALFDALGQIFFFCIVIALAYIYQSVLAMVIALLVSEAIKVGMSYWLFGIPVKPRLPKWNHLKEIIKHGKYFFLIAMGGFITIQMDDLAIGKWLGADVLGYYYIGYSIINVLVTVIRKLFGRVLFPFYTKLVAGKKEAHKRINRILEDQILLLCVCFTLIFIFASPLIHLFFSDQWVEAIPMIQILTLTGLIRGVGNLIAPLFLAEKKQNVLAAGRIIEVILFLPVIYLFTMQYNAIGTAFAVGLIFVIALTYRIVMAYRLFKLEVMKSMAITFLFLFVVIITSVFFAMVYKPDLFVYVKYGAAPVFIIIILAYFLKRGKTISYFMKQYLHYD